MQNLKRVLAVVLCLCLLAVYMPARSCLLL